MHYMLTRVHLITCAQQETLCSVGANWQRLKVAHRQRRRDMLHLYDNKRHLVPVNSLDFTRATRPSIHATGQLYGLAMGMSIKSCLGKTVK